MPIKDANYWKEYNQKRKEYLQQKYQQRKQVVNSTTDNSVVKNNPVVKSEVVKSDAVVENILQPNKKVVESCKIIQPELVVKKDNLQPCQSCIQLKKENQALQWEVDDCNKRHTISKDADFIDLMWDKRYTKFIFYSCPDSCWNGKYCNNCYSLEQQIEKRIESKNKTNH